VAACTDVVRPFRGWRADHVYAAESWLLFLFVIMLVNVGVSSKERQSSHLAGRIGGGVRADGIVRVRVGEGQGVFPSDW